MSWRIALATNVEGSPSAVYDVLRSTQGQKSFWTSDCELDENHGRFGFVEAPVDLNVSISLVANELVRMKVDSGFPGWNGSTWEWTLSANHDNADETSVQFRHYDFEDDCSEASVAYTAQSWAMILERLARFQKSGVADPYFTNEGT